MEKIKKSEIVENFKSHLNIDFNNRILFSAPFGAGKSTFLNDFFDEKHRDYAVVKLYPVNYAVSSDDNIFELIKFDIILELLTKYKEQIKFEKEDFSFLLKTQVFATQKLDILSILKTLVDESNKIGKTALGLLDAIKDIIKEYKEFDENTVVDEEKVLLEYLRSIENVNPVLSDDISLLISSLLSRLTKESSLKTVLVIDDLDRLDPEHVFRLFNIFSAHYDVVSDRNKFDFEKVIFVCDIENIRKMYIHRYGNGVDFSGYIDKFFSIDVFEFDNRKYIKESIDLIFKDVPFRTSQSGLDIHYKYNPHNNFSKGLKFIIIALLDSKLLTLRMLFQVKEFYLPEYTFSVSGSRNRPSVLYEFLILINFLKIILSGKDNLTEKMKVLKNRFNELYIISEDEYENKQVINNLINISLSFLVDETKSFNKQYDNREEDIYNLNNNFIHYSVTTETFSKFYTRTNDFTLKKITTTSSPDSEEVKVNVFEVVYEALENCLRRGYIK